MAGTCNQLLCYGKTFPGEDTVKTLSEPECYFEARWEHVVDLGGPLKPLERQSDAVIAAHFCRRLVDCLVRLYELPALSALHQLAPALPLDLHTLMHV